MKHFLILVSIVALLITIVMTCTNLPDASMLTPVKFKPAVVTKFEQAIRITESKDTSLIVSVKGSGPMSYAWYRNQTRIDTTARDTLTLKNTQLTQAGTYTVVVTNDWGKDSCSTTLSIDTLYYSIAVSYVGKGSVSPLGNNGIVKVRPLATPVFSYKADSGCYVDSVFVNKVHLPSYATSSLYTFSPINTDGAFRVVFKNVTFTLAITPPVNGKIMPDPLPKTEFLFGDTITLAAVADKGYYFGGWGGDASGTDATLRVVMNANKKISATFADTSKFSLTVSSPNGSVTLNPPSGVYSPGTLVKLSASPASGYMFTSWSDSASGSNDTVTITMNSKKIVTANFQPKAYTLFLSAGAGGSVTTPSSAWVYANEGGATPITATPNFGAVFCAGTWIAAQP